MEYYENNFAGTINLINAMKAAGCKNLVFSSSCTVYGMPEKASHHLMTNGVQTFPLSM